MSSKEDDRARKVIELKTRFPDADTDVIRDALTHAHDDVHNAANILVGFGCRQAPPAVSLQQPQFPQPSQAAPVRAVQPPPRASVFNDFNSAHVERALEQTKGNQAAALEILLSLGDAALAAAPPAAAPAHQFAPPPPLSGGCAASPIQILSRQSAFPPSAPVSIPVCAPSGGHNQQRAAEAPPVTRPLSEHALQVHPEHSVGVPLAMLSTMDQIRRAESESKQLYEQEMRSKKVHVFVDLSNVSIGAQVGADGKSRDLSVRISVADLVDCVHQGRDVQERHVITSIDKSLDGSKQPAFIRDWQKLGYDVRVQERRGGSEQFLDEVLIVAMQQTMLKFGSSRPDQKQRTLVLLSGDGNNNDDHTSFAETVECALGQGFFVEIWAWKHSASRVYTKSFKENYGGSFTVRFFDDFRDRIIRKSARSSAVASAAVVDDDDDDWMVCPISFEVIVDAAATKFAPMRFYERRSLENWVRKNGSCPFTRKSCTPQGVTHAQDIISRVAEMRSRMQSHSQRPSRSPPAPARFHIGGTGAVAAAAAASEVVKIPADQVRRLIGTGGATIKQISAQTGAEIHVDDDGTVRIDSFSADCVRRAKDVIAGMFKEVQLGETFQVQVVSVKDFGCFVKLPSGRDGLVHISELSSHRVNRVEDVVQIGQTIWVKCVGFDESGRIRLSLKAAMKDREHGGGAARA